MKSMKRNETKEIKQRNKNSKQVEKIKNNLREIGRLNIKKIFRS